MTVGTCVVSVGAAVVGGCVVEVGARVVEYVLQLLVAVWLKLEPELLM